MFCFDFFIADCKSKTFFCFSVTSHCQQKLTEADAELLINELCFVRSYGIEVVGPCFYLLYKVNKGGHLGLLPHPVEADEREAKLPISDFPSDKCPVDAYPPSWSVRTQKLLDCLQYLRVANIPDILCGEQQQDSVFSGWQSCKRFYDSLFDWWRCSLAVGLYAEVIGARYNSIFFLLLFFAFDLAVCPSQIVRCGADLCYQTVNDINGIWMTFYVTLGSFL